MRIQAICRSLTKVLILLCLAATTLRLVAQTTAPTTAPTAAPTTNPSRLMGTVTVIGSGNLTVKTDADGEHKVAVPDGISLKRIAPGEKDLSKATPIQFSDFAVGDRVLVRIAADSATEPFTAASIIAIPQADLAQKQEKDREDWQRRGVGGLVKSVDPGAGVVLITSGTGASLKTITLRMSTSSTLRRYAANSVDFAKTTPAPFDAIKVGDQLRARGTKTADGTEVAVEEVVSGSFRNIAGTVSSVNPSAMTVTVKDLTSKQTVTVHIGSDVLMKKLPEAGARMLALGGIGGGASGPRTSAPDAAAGPAAGPGAGLSGNSSGRMQGNSSSAAARQGPSDHPSGAQESNSPSTGGQGGSWAAGSIAGSGEAQQLMNRAPIIHITDLQKGDAVMLVSTQGTSDVTAITLLAGVEPLLQAPTATQNMLLSNWNMSSGGAEAAQ